MFTRKSTLIKKTGPDGVGRYDFLKQLIVEFGTTKSIEAKRQVLANLANFAYDPVNFEFLKQLHAIDLFLDQLSGDDEELLRFGLAAICNMCPDLETKDYVVKLNGIKLISNQLLNKDEEIALNAITALYYIFFPAQKHLITKEILDKVNSYEASPNPRFAVRRFSNVAVFCKTVTKEDVAKFTEVSGDTNPVHSTIVHGAFLNSLVSKVIGTQMPGPGSIVVAQTLNFPNKCFVGDDVKVTVELVENRKIIKVKYKCEVPNRGKIVLYGEAKLVLNKSDV